LDAEVDTLVEVGIASLSVDSRTNQPVIVLRPVTEAKGQGRILPIWIGHPEAAAILFALEGTQLPRPLTHDLLRNVLETLDVVLERVEITRIEDGTFYAALILRGEERTLAVDARPSDSIALALRTAAPIFVAESVLEEAAVPYSAVSEDDTLDEEAEIEEMRRFLESVDPSEFGG
jgi:bifunctional DNase/RNase